MAERGWFRGVLIPTPPELDSAPELAALAVLEAALGAAEYAVIAGQPALRDTSEAHELDELGWCAATIVDLAAELTRAISAYRGALRLRSHAHLRDEDEL